jgi:hypothetical protein
MAQRNHRGRENTSNQQVNSQQPQTNIDQILSISADKLETDISQTIKDNLDSVTMAEIVNAQNKSVFKELSEYVISQLQLGNKDLDTAQKLRLENYITSSSRTILESQTIDASNVNTICALYSELKISPNQVVLKDLISSSSDKNLRTNNNLKKLRNVVNDNEFTTVYRSLLTSFSDNTSVTSWLETINFLGQTIEDAEFAHISQYLDAICFERDPLSSFNLSVSRQVNLLYTMNSSFANKFESTNDDLRNAINTQLRLSDSSLADALLAATASATPIINDINELRQAESHSLTVEPNVGRSIVINHLNSSRFTDVNGIQSFINSPLASKFANRTELNPALVNALRSVLLSTTTDAGIKTWLDMWHESGQSLTTTEFTEVAEALNEINFEVPPLQNFGLNNDQRVTLLANITDPNGSKFRTTNQDLRNLINTRIPTGPLKTNLLNATNVTPANTISDFSELESQLSLNVNVDPALARRIVTEHFESAAFSDLNAIQTLLDNQNVQNILAENDRKRLAQAAVVRLYADAGNRNISGGGGITIPSVGMLGDWIRAGSREFLNGADVIANQNYDQEQAFNIIAFCLWHSSVATTFNHANGNINTSGVNDINNTMYGEICSGIRARREIDLSSYITNLSRDGFINVLEQFTADELQRVILERRPDYVNHLTSSGSTHAELIRLLTTGQTAEQVQNNADRLNMNTLVRDFTTLGNQYNAGTTLDTDAYRQRARTVITEAFNVRDFAGLENLLRDRVVLNYFPDDTERLNLAKTRLVTSLLTQVNRTSYISGLDTTGGYLRDVCVAASERALRASDIVSNRVYNLDDQNALDEIFGILMFASCQVNGASRTGGSEISDVFTQNPVQRTITTPVTLGNYNSIRAAELNVYNDDVDRLVVGLETESERARAMRDPQTAPHLIHTMRTEMNNILTLNNFDDVITSPISGHPQFTNRNQTISAIEQYLFPDTPVMGAPQAGHVILSDVRNLKVIAIALGVNGDVGSENFRRDMISKLTNHLMTTNLTAAGAEYAENLSGTHMTGRQNDLYNDIMQRYSDSDINRREVQDQIAAEVAQRSMEDRLQAIRTESETVNANQSLVSMLAGDWGGRFLPEGIKNAALAVGLGVVSSGSTGWALGQVSGYLWTGLKTVFASTSSSLLVGSAALWATGKLFNVIADARQQNSGIGADNQGISDLLASNAVVRVSNGQLRIDDNSDAARNSGRIRQVENIRNSWTANYRTQLSTASSNLSGTGSLNDRVSSCITAAYNTTEMNVGSLNQSVRNNTGLRAIANVLQTGGMIGSLGAPWLLGGALRSMTGRR